MKNGFSLIELLVVMAIIGGIASFALMTSRTGSDKAYDAQRRSDLKQYQAALEVYANKNANKYPIGEESLHSLCTSTLLLDQCPKNPLGDYHLKSVTGYEYYLWTELGVKTDSKQTQYFVICSNGKVNDTTTIPSGDACPL